MPRFILVVSNPRGQWEESYDKPVDDPAKWAQDTISWFNRTRRPGELPRTFVGVRIVGDSEEHVWEKTNLVTIVYRDRLYDTARCTCCGVTGRRYGLSPEVVRDRVFKAKKYAKCKGTPVQNTGGD